MAEESATPNPRRAARRAASKPSPRVSPTRSIEPGLVHYQIADTILKGVQAKAQEVGVHLDVGELPASKASELAGNEDPAQLVNIVAHAVARIGDRFGFVRKLSRHAEGQEKRAGIVSDITSALFTLYKRNPEEMQKLGTALYADIRQRREQAAQQQAMKQAQAQANGNHADPTRSYQVQ